MEIISRQKIRDPEERREWRAAAMLLGVIVVLCLIAQACKPKADKYDCAMLQAQNIPCDILD